MVYIQTGTSLLTGLLVNQQDAKSEISRVPTMEAEYICSNRFYIDTENNILLAIRNVNLSLHTGHSRPEYWRTRLRKPSKPSTQVVLPICKNRDWKRIVTIITIKN